MLNKCIEKKLLYFLEEDIQTGDITSDYIFNDTHISTAELFLKEKEAVLCGVDFFTMCFNLIDSKIKIKKYYNDGDIVKQNDIILKLTGLTKNILKAERTALNIIQRLSGIATKSNKYNKILEGTSVKILDTRKTLPGFRYFDKYAVRIGGCKNHRFGLYDMVLIKDNHIKASGSLDNAVAKIKNSISPYIKIEVETANMKEVEEAVKCPVDIIMLDNMNFETTKLASALIRKANPNILIEVSGNITFDKIMELKSIDIDFISTGALTHSVSAIDFSLKI